MTALTLEQLRALNAPGGMPQAGPPPRYSLTSLLADEIHRKSGASQKTRPGSNDMIERIASRRLRRARGWSPTEGGVTIPYEALRTLNWTEYGAGGAMSMATTWDGVSEDLRPASLLDELNVSRIEGLQRYGDLILPVADGSVKATWIAPDGTEEVPEADSNVNSVTMTPKHLGAYIDVTRQAIDQATVSVEAWLRRALGMAVETAISEAMFGGTGGKQPVGLMVAPGVAYESWASEPDFGQLADLFEEVGESAVDERRLTWVISPKTAAAFRKKVAGVADATADLQTWGATLQTQGRNILGGTGPCIVSRLAPDEAVFCGDWANALLGVWRALDILVDPFSRGVEKVVRLVVMANVDWAFTQRQGFAVGIWG